MRDSFDGVTIESIAIVQSAKEFHHRAINEDKTFLVEITSDQSNAISNEVVF